MEKFARLEEMDRRFQEIDSLLADPEVVTNPQRIQSLARERASIEDLVTTYREFKEIGRELEDSRAMLEDNLDEEMAPPWFKMKSPNWSSASNGCHRRFRRPWSRETCGTART